MPKPRKYITESQVLELARRQWSNVEIAAFFGCHEKTIRRKFNAELLESARQEGKDILMRVAWHRAIGTKEKDYKDGSDNLLKVLLGMHCGYKDPLRVKIGTMVQNNLRMEMTENNVEKLVQEIENMDKEELKWTQTPSLPSPQQSSQVSS